MTTNVLTIPNASTSTTYELPIPNVSTGAPSQKFGKVNLNFAQHASGGEYKSQLDPALFLPPPPQIERGVDDFNPYREWYLNQIVGIYELPKRRPGTYIIPQDLNQNRFLVSPLNSRGEMHGNMIYDTNLLLTNQLF